MIAYSMILLASVMEYGFEVLDTTDSEWVAPGYELIEEAVINPREYGEPIRRGDGYEADIACQAFFGERDGQEVWKIIAVLNDLVVVFEEDQEPRQYSLLLDPSGAYFSPGGKYVVVISNEGCTSAEFLDTETGEGRLFHPSLGEERVTLFPGDDGSLIGIGHETVYSYDDDLIPSAHQYPDAYLWQPLRSVSGALTIVEDVASRPRRIMALDKSGELLWQTGIGLDEIRDYPGIPLDDSYVMIPVQGVHPEAPEITGETIFLSAADGCILRIESSRICGAVPGSESDLLLGSTVSASPTDARDALAFVDGSELRLSKSPLQADTWYGARWRDGDGLIRMQHRTRPWMSRLVLVDLCENVVWASVPFDVEGEEGLLRAATCNLNAGILGAAPACLGQDRAHLVYLDGSRLRVLRFRHGLDFF